MIRCPNCVQVYSSSVSSCPHCEFSPPEIEGVRSWASELALAGSGFKAEYFANLAALEAENFWFRARNALIVWALKKHFPDLRSFMEVGCGTGFVLSGIAAAFPTADLFGSEIFSAGLGFASRRIKDAHFIQMDGRKIPYEDEFDVIGAFDVLEHISEDEIVLARMCRAAKPGGGVILTVPQHRLLWSAADEYACHVRRYTSAEIRLKVENAGLEILRSTSFVSLLLPAMLFSRRGGRKDRHFDPCSEFCISRTLNRTLENLLKLEQILIRMGLSFPVGGSRLIVARRMANDSLQ